MNVIAMGLLNRKWHLALMMLKHDATVGKGIMPNFSLFIGRMDLVIRSSNLY